MAAAARTAPLALIADIGGTNARFALTDLTTPTAQVLEPRSLDASRFASLQHAAEHYLDDLDVRPRHAAIAVASPVSMVCMC
jgi:glucokinase